MTDRQIDIGNKLRRLRKIKKISLKQLAEDTNMSYSYLSGLENGKHSITINNLQRLSAYFSVDIIYFFDVQNGEEAVLVRKNDKDIISTEDGISFSILTNSSAKNLQISIIKQPPNTPEEKKLHHHEKGEEFIHVIKGKLYVIRGNSEYSLTAGDSIFYKSNIDHLMYTENQLAEYFLINSPPYGTNENPDFA